MTAGKPRKARRAPDANVTAVRRLIAAQRQLERLRIAHAYAEHLLWSDFAKATTPAERIRLLDELSSTLTAYAQAAKSLVGKALDADVKR